MLYHILSPNFHNTNDTFAGSYIIHKRPKVSHKGLWWCITLQAKTIVYTLGVGCKVSEERFFINGL